MSSGLYRSQLRRRNNRFRGFLFGVAIGEALKGPYKNITPEMKKILGVKSSTTKHIDIFPSNNRVTGTWSTLTSQFLTGTLAMDYFKKGYGDGNKFFDKSFMTARLAEASDNFASKLADQPTSLDYKPNQVLFHAAPAMLISQSSKMNISQLITFVAQMDTISQLRPIDIFPAIELIYLMLSILRRSETIPDGYNKLKSFMEKSRLSSRYQFQEYEKYRLRPLTEIDPDSSLWLLRNVSDILGVSPGKKWSDIPEFLPGLLKVKNESPYPDAAGALAGLILGGYAGYAGAIHRASSESSLYDNIPDKLIRNLWETQIIEELAGEICTNFGWSSMTIGSRRPRPKQEKKSKKPQISKPFMIFRSSEELPCAFLTLIVKNEFIQKKYPGGIRAYVTKHWSLVNNRISIISHMSDEFQDVMQDLQEHGLSRDDYTFIDCNDCLCRSMLYTSAKKRGCTTKSKEEWIEESMNSGLVDWLHIRERNNRYYVSYVEGGIDKKIEVL